MTTESVHLLTPREALAFPRPGKPKPGVCAGNPGQGKRFDHHNLMPLPTRPWKRYAERDVRWSAGAQQWSKIKVGRVCNFCYAVYDPTPMCAWEGCRNVSKAREVGTVAGRWGEKAAEHDYCGVHSPAGELARRSRKAEQRAALMREREERNRPFAEYDAAEEAVLVEAMRWREDEEATGEGFCDFECEHHECRLALVVRRYEEAVGAMLAIRRAEGVPSAVTDRVAR